MSGISSNLVTSLREVLADCEPFETNRGVRNLFSDKRIIPWRNNLPQADTLLGRVDGVISYLHDKNHSDGSNALVLMLNVLVDTISQEDSRHDQIKTLAYKLTEASNVLPQSVIPRVSGNETKIPSPPSTVPLVESNHSKQKFNTSPSPKRTKTKKIIDPEKIDFFISYNRNDKKWAEWIAWQLENAGYTTIIQAWDFRPGGNFVTDMQNATTNAERTIAVLSPDYLASKFTQPEWNAAFALDPTGVQGLLLPIKVRDCELKGLLPQIVYIDLMGLSADEANEVLLSGVKRGRAKPIKPPNFPGMVERAEPEFPKKS